MIYLCHVCGVCPLPDRRHDLRAFRVLFPCIGNRLLAATPLAIRIPGVLWTWASSVLPFIQRAVEVRL